MLLYFTNMVTHQQDFLKTPSDGYNGRSIWSYFDVQSDGKNLFSIQQN